MDALPESAGPDVDLALALVDSAPDGFVVVDVAGNIVLVNRQMRELFGYESDEMLALTIDELVPERFRRAHRVDRTSYGDAPRTRAMGSGTLLFGRRKDGGEFPVEISLSPVPSADGPRIVAIVRDVTQRIEAEDRLRQAEREVNLLEDRERIARDLHDLVIQRLFAAGMSLQAAQARSKQEEVTSRILTVVEDLDDTIRELRSVIFGLQADLRASGLRSQILRTVAEGSRSLGFEPHVRLDGLIDTLDETIATELVATLREALSNVARHADAGSVDVVLECESDVVLRVVDDGRGIPVTPRGGSGIINVTERASLLGGRCRVTRRPEGGTMLEWSVPNAGSLTRR